MATPVVSSVSPASYQIGSTGKSVTVSGQNFESGATVVFTFGVTLTSTTIDNSGQISVILDVPQGTEGTGDVQVINPAGEMGELAPAYITFLTFDPGGPPPP